MKANRLESYWNNKQKKQLYLEGMRILRMKEPSDEAVISRGRFALGFFLVSSPSESLLLGTVGGDGGPPIEGIVDPSGPVLQSKPGRGGRMRQDPLAGAEHLGSRGRVEVWSLAHDESLVEDVVAPAVGVSLDGGGMGCFPEVDSAGGVDLDPFSHAKQLGEGAVLVLINSTGRIYLRE